MTIAEFLNVVLPSPEVDVGVTAKTEPFTLGDCRPDYKESLITPADVTKALCVLLAMAPIFWEAWEMFVSSVTDAVLNSFRSKPFRCPGVFDRTGHARADSPPEPFHDAVSVCETLPQRKVPLQKSSTLKGATLAAQHRGGV